MFARFEMINIIHRNYGFKSITDTLPVCLMLTIGWHASGHRQQSDITTNHNTYTMKPVCNGHLYNKINYLWFIR